MPSLRRVQHAAAEARGATVAAASGTDSCGGGGSGSWWHDHVPSGCGLQCLSQRLKRALRLGAAVARAMMVVVVHHSRSGVHVLRVVEGSDAGAQRWRRAAACTLCVKLEEQQDIEQEEVLVDDIAIKAEQEANLEGWVAGRE